ncbi:MAG: IS110 family transposase [Thermoplasmata archaeon]|nr:IS110 family transposase [Thermoplasmata archaeon]
MESLSSTQGETFVGLDVHRKTVVATAVDPLGHPVSQVTLGPSDAELAEYLRTLPGTKHVALEACPVWEHFFDAAESTGAAVVLSNPLKTRLIAEASLKTDRVDSEALATLLRLGALPTSYAPPSAIRDLRAQIRERVFYRRKTGAVLQRIYPALLRRGIEYEDGLLQHRRKREVLRDLHLSEVDRGLDALRYLEDLCRELDRGIEEACENSPEAQLLRTIPGVGPLTATAVVAFLTPIERFSSVEKLSSYVGLCPTTRQSADSIHYGSLKRDSNGLVRWLLVEASWHRRRVPRGAVARVANRVGRRRGKQQGTIAGTHTLLKIIYAMLKRKEAFRSQAPGPSTSVRIRRRHTTTARICVRRTALELPTANSPSAS